ncbi:MAG TPA: EAL domain-containing protein [Woeseiaceae bacterium]|nr:EAL domain-containing protein [Woeseiaceae bacterium]
MKVPHRIARGAALAWHRSRRRVARAVDRASGGSGSRGGKRVLIHEILTLQIVITAAIGALAIASLYWGGQWVLQDNYSRWALQWTDELNELGAPLYLGHDQELMLRLERFIAKYPEIHRVTWYREDGSTLYSIDNASLAGEAASPLSPALLAELAALVGSEHPYLIDSDVLDVRSFTILAPIWTEAVLSDGLFGFHPGAEPGSARDLSGFVGLELDFGFFHERLVVNIKIATSVLLVLLVVSGFVGRRILRRALMAISDLQQPIAELAKGNLAVEFKPAQHREISEIVEALESTASALGERNERLSRLANHDPLTGLFNRRRFVEELKKVRRASSRPSGALLFIDLDQFKYVNDTCGHPAGDRLIRKVAQQLSHSVGDRGIVARFGGDEFVCLAPGVSRRGARALAESVLEDMRRLAHVEDGNVFHVHCSIGIAMISDRLDHDELIAQADIACREAKASGRNRLAFHSKSGREAEQMVADVNWVSKLRSAIDNDEFLLRYQPIVSLATGKTTHHEVLLRMRGDNGRMVAPEAFLPAAARFGLMAEIDTWVVEATIRELARYRVDSPDLCFSLNLSANAFEAENLVAWVGSQLNRHGVPPENVVFEITESLAVRHLEHVEKQIAGLRELGCRLALDDFGTGYSSFSYLQRLPVDYIKIDGAFIRDIVNNPVDQKMVRLIGEIGREAGMRTIAEYVQSSAAFSLLGKLGIDYAQGFYIGRPSATPIRKEMPVELSGRRARRHGSRKRAQ